MEPERDLLLAGRVRARQRVAALEREFAGLAEAASAAGTDDEHDPEGATLAFERQHAAALLAAAREQVAALDDALRRLAEGRYGVCDRCGQPIGAERLAARPAAVTCVRCAAGGRRRGSGTRAAWSSARAGPGAEYRGPAEPTVITLSSMPGSASTSAGVAVSAATEV
jgi:DnaK suppressor protein